MGGQRKRRFRRECAFVCLSVVAVLVLVAGPAFADRAADLAQRARNVGVETCEDVETFEDCHEIYAGGCSNSEQPRYDPYLNFLKNQVPSPDLRPDKIIGLADLKALEGKTPPALGKGNHAQHAQALVALGEGNIYSVIGYLFYAKVTRSPETTNCQLTGMRNSDFHIGIGFDPAIAARLRGGEQIDPDELGQVSMVVEMTPHYRAQFHRKWTIGRLRSRAGAQVMVIGQLLVDNEHANAKQDCGRAGADRDTCWRLSAWELHPVIQFYVCTDGTSCTSAAAGWKKLEDF